jgi:hypothetical protein
VRLFIIRYDLNSVVHQNLYLDFFVMIFLSRYDFYTESIDPENWWQEKSFFNSRDAVVAI